MMKLLGICCIIVILNEIQANYNINQFNYESSVPTNSPTSNPNPLNFLLIGDWGKGGHAGDLTAISSGNIEPFNDNDDNPALAYATTYTYQVAVAGAMAAYANLLTPAPSFVVALGDNFYTNGVESATDSLWDSLWREVYISSYPLLDIPWYAVFGNHDYGYGNTGVQAQIIRSELEVDNGSWVMPSTNFSRTFRVPDGGVTLTVVFIDTTTLAPSENKCCNSKGGVSESTQLERINNQLHHINTMLTEATASSPDWLLVAGHYPIYSAGSHGDTDELLTYLLPLLQEYNVDAYICGHDHISEHLSKDGIEYFVAGAGSMIDYLGSTTSAATLQWSGTGYSAFAAASATKDQLTISYHDIYGNMTYSYTIGTSSMAGTRGGGTSSSSSSSDESDNGNNSSPDFPYPVIYKLLIALVAIFGAVMAIVTVERAIYLNYTKDVLLQVEITSTDHTTHNNIASTFASGGAAMLHDYSTHTNLESPLSPNRGPRMTSEI